MASTGRGVVARLASTNPARLVVGAYLTAVVVGTTLLSLPVATETGEAARPLDALFTATSAICVTGLVVLDTGSVWGPFGEGVVLALIQLGGAGLMTIATLLALAVGQRLSLGRRALALAERQTLSSTDVTKLLLAVLRFSLVTEAVLALVLGLRLWTAYDYQAGEAAWLGIFHSLSAFNNAGFDLFGDSLIGFAGDPLVVLPISVAIVMGGIGFPVLVELWRLGRRRRRGGRSAGAVQPVRLSLHTRMTLLGSAVLLAGGTVLIALTEWRNPLTAGAYSTLESLMTSWFMSVTTRTAGFSTIDVGGLDQATLLAIMVLMFIGGGSASCAGGIKVSTWATVGAGVWAEVRGDPEVSLLGRRIDSAVLRQALAVTVIGLTVCVTATILVSAFSVDEGFTLTQVLFECVSAFGTVGLSTGITGDLPDPARALLVVVMLVGRTGPATVAAALAVRTRKRRFGLPAERPVIG